jgi:hypothetical protein
LLRRIGLTLLLSHTWKREWQAHARYRQAELTLLSGKWYVQSLLVNLKSVSTRAYTLHMEALATDGTVWRLGLLTLGAVRLSGRVRIRRAFGSNGIRGCVFSSSLRIVRIRSWLIAYRYTLMLRELSRRKL